jgi:hypothetical protein
VLNWTESLLFGIENLDIIQTAELNVDTTAPGGGILNIPFVDANARATDFSCTYWIETIQPPDGSDPVQQLQYMQQTNIEFIEDPKSKSLIVWPHVNVNTLRKQ